MTTKEFLTALVAVRDQQLATTVGFFTFSPDNRLGVGFRSEQNVMLDDPLSDKFPICTRVGGMRNWPHSDAGMRRIARSYANANIAETERRQAISARGGR